MGGHKESQQTAHSWYFIPPSSLETRAAFCVGVLRTPHWNIFNVCFRDSLMALSLSPRLGIRIERIRAGGGFSRDSSPLFSWSEWCLLTVLLTGYSQSTESGGVVPVPLSRTEVPQSTVEEVRTSRILIGVSGRRTGHSWMSWRGPAGCPLGRGHLISSAIKIYPTPQPGHGEVRDKLR